MPIKDQCEVLVVGAGPVGLFAALCLAQRGVDVVVVDKADRTNLHSYALCVHSRALEKFEEVGMAERLLDSGRRLWRTVFYDDKEPRAVADFSVLNSKYPCSLVIWQSSLELALVNRLHEMGVDVNWNYEVSGLEQTVDGATAEVVKITEMAQGYPWTHIRRVRDGMRRIKAKFVIGADGYHSFVRRYLDSRMRASGDPIHLSVFEFHSGSKLEDEQRVVLNENSSNVLWPMCENMCRWSFQETEADRFGLASLSELRTFLEERAPWFDPTPERLEWSTRVRFERRLTDSWGRGRFWLIGDAAHLNYPIGVQSMNAGIVSGATLVERIHSILRKKSDAAVLEEWANERQNEWERLLGFRNPFRAPTDDEWIQQNFGRILCSLPATGPDLELLVEGLQPGMSLV